MKLILHGKGPNPFGGMRVVPVLMSPLTPEIKMAKPSKKQIHSDLTPFAGKGGLFDVEP